MTPTKRAVVLLSGGLDSATVLAMALADGFHVTALSVLYGQRHALELQSAKRIAKARGVIRHEVAHINMFGGSTLIGRDGNVPKNRKEPGVIPETYVPARNTILLGMALSLAEVTGSTDVFIGANAVDYSGYPDCRPAFILAFETLANLATRTAGEHRYRVHAPLIQMTKAEIILAGARLGVDFALTSSCYDPTTEGACGACDSCVIRRKGFTEAGMVDPIPYRSTP